MDSFLRSLLPVVVVVIAMWAMTAAYWQKFRPGAARYVAYVGAGVGIVMAILMWSLAAGLGYFLPLVGYGLGHLMFRLAAKEWTGRTREGWGLIFWMVLCVVGLIAFIGWPSVGTTAIFAFFLGNVIAAGRQLPPYEEPEPETDDEPPATPAGEEEGFEEEPERRPTGDPRGFRPA